MRINFKIRKSPEILGLANKFQKLLTRKEY
jgi:hypothetical protein